ncbi:hypothetical protein [Burkholderia multivorans]|uniref:hypothetical protein n=1 Tax=Burkholderia multivorans TaxID=87883 RepID=UPI0012DAE39E|nr:hypothetical protein [Burkholderia multivorans]
MRTPDVWIHCKMPACEHPKCSHTAERKADQALEPADPGLSEKGSGAAQQRRLRTTGRADQGCAADCSPVDGRWIQLTGKGTADSLQFISIEYTH